VPQARRQFGVSVSEIASIATVEPTELFLWEMCHQYALEYPSPKHPVRSELIAAFVPRLVRHLLMPQVAALVIDFASSPDLQFELQGSLLAEAADLLKAFDEELVSQIIELDSYLHEPGIDKAECGSWLTSWEYSFREASELMSRAQQYHRGRRPVKRVTAVDVLESRRIDKCRTWRDLAHEFCDCADSRHDESCQDALRKSTSRLESVLKKYREISVPAEPLAPLAKMCFDRLGWKQF
jgi:hypothetical protein